MLTILEQFERKCEEGEGDVICPVCKVEIGQYDDWVIACNHIEHDRCPICDCGTFGEDCNGTYEWCENCTDWCEAREEQEEQAEYERYAENQWRSELLSR